MRNTTKRTLAMIICLTMMLTLQPAAAPPALAAAPEWTAVGGPGFSADSVWYTSLAIASDGTPYIAYEDYGNAWKATVMRYNGAGWEEVGSPGFSAGQAEYTFLAFDNVGTPYVAYKDASYSGKATVMKYTGAGVTGWEEVGSPGFSAGTASYISLAFDGGTPYVAYADVPNSQKATVMKYTGAVGTGWEPVGSAGFSTGTVFYTSLAIDSGGTPYVAYRDNGNSNKATVMKYNGISWEAVGSPGFSTGFAEYTSLAIDNAGTPYVAYMDHSYSDKATVMKYNGISWEAVGNPGFSAGTVSDISLAIGSGGTPYVAYKDWNDIDNKATVMKYTGIGSTGWEAVGSAGFSAGTVSDISLAIGSGGTLYVAYQDDVYDRKATVMQYIPDTIAPALTAGGVSRSSDSAATVSFTSDEDGKYYYAVVVEGAAAPAIDTSGAGTACSAGDQTIALTSLTAGSWDIYIKVKDDSGNVSNAISMTIPALMAGIPNLTATAGSAGVHLSWTPVAASVSYSVYQSTISGTYGSALDSVASSVYSYDAVGLTNNVTYYFMVSALDSYGNTANSNEASATPRQHSGTSSGNDDVLSFTTEKAVQPEPEPEPEEKQMFSDVPDTHWAYASINQLCQKGAVSGYKDGSFRPDDPITRAEFITILVKALDLRAAATAQNFSDTADHWAQENIAAAASLGIAGGYADGSFKPDALITREQMAVMAVKAAGVTAGFGETAFTDNEEISFWAKGSVLAAVDAGIMTGYPDNTFRPQGNATRAEAVCVILNLIK